MQKKNYRTDNHFTESHKHIIYIHFYIHSLSLTSMRLHDAYYYLCGCTWLYGLPSKHLNRSVCYYTSSGWHQEPGYEATSLPTSYQKIPYACSELNYIDGAYAWDIIFNKLVLYKEPKFLASLSILSVFPHLQLLQDHPCSWGHREGYSLSSFPFEWSSSRQWHSRWHYPHTRPTF